MYDLLILVLFAKITPHNQQFLFPNKGGLFNIKTISQNRKIGLLQIPISENNNLSIIAFL
jgi:hypothetical protein